MLIQNPPLVCSLNMTPKNLCSFQHVDFAYEGSLRVLRDVHLHVKQGTCLALLGASGSGKSTMGLLWDKCVNAAIKSGMPEFIIDVFKNGTRREKLELTKAIIAKAPSETKLSGDLGVGPTIILIAPDEAKNGVISTQLDTKQDSPSTT